jgi:23S rRNA (uracil1939-C5)-methyltransferase
MLQHHGFLIKMVIHKNVLWILACMQERHSEKRRKNELLRILEPEQRVAPPCKHFLEGCGGCLDQDYAYDVQVKAKEQFLREHYGRDVRVVPCPEPFGYRNRMDFVQAFGKSGLRKRGKFAQVVDVKDCLLIPEFAREAYKRVRDLVMMHKIQDYNYVRHEGFLKYIVVRMNRVTKGLMIILTTAEPSEQEASFRDFLDVVYAEIRPESLWWTIVKGKADTSIGVPHLHIGEDHIIDEIAGRRFKITPTTFFQANTAMAGALFTKAAAYAQGDVLDLYCGVGAISLIVAPNVKSVVGIELNQESISMAKENARLNAITNAEFHAADAATWLAQNQRRFDTVIVDPARPGLGKAACALLRDLAPRHIIYISCNALTHKDDLDALSETYDLVLLEGHDLFPQTPHVEILSVLERKGSA